MVKEGIPFVAIPLIAGLLLGIFGFLIAAAVILLIAAFMIFFFRDPKRAIPQGRGLIVSAADGRVTRIENDGETKLVSVFLSPLDVHINRSPIAGRISKISYQPGRKMPATSDKASLVNERNSLVIEGDEMTVTCTQIAGILARRIVCWPKTGDNLTRGEKFGLIKFGSRTDVRMPAGVDVLVKVGDRVKGGETVIGRMTSVE
ncbi:MAG TPA: phosphatidylserine decarboxylase [Pyrinomonadaceae bacterium]|nr:phosphatidylserine decarboxylase [Pyrinomonadaceae bacterium]